MSHACTLILVGVASPVLEILLLSKMAKFPFQPMDYTTGVKKLNWLKIFMQVEVDVKCMQTNFGGHGLSGFRDFFSEKIESNKIGSKNSCM